MLIFCTMFKFKKSLHMLQQNLYNENNRYIKWMIKNNKIFFDLDLSILLISSYSIPMAISKVISERLALKQYRNAQKVFHGALIYAGLVGGIAAAVAFFFGKSEIFEVFAGIYDAVSITIFFAN